VGEKTPKGLNSGAKIDDGHLCLRKEHYMFKLEMRFNLHLNGQLQSFNGQHARSMNLIPLDRVTERLIN
jgi:hypothetical protein